MSKLEELIASLCLDGVDYIQLDSFAKVIRGKRLTKSQLTDNGKYKVFHGGLEPLGYYDEYNREADTVMILNVGASAGTIAYSYKHFWSSDGCFCIEKTDNVLDRFLYHYLKNNESYFKSRVRVAAIPTLDRAIIEQFMIPIPPLEVQAEIVRILDKFTELISLLERELKLRREQYEYYRDKFLTFNDEVKRKALSEVCDLSAGGDIPKDRFSRDKTEIYTVPVISNGVGDKALQGYTDIPTVTHPAVTVSARGTIGYSSLRTEPFYPIVRLIVLTPHEELLPGFLKYAVEMIKFIIPRSGIPQLTIPMISKYTIPVPPLEVQQKIVNKLDKFTGLISLVEQELAARRKQYAYYCDKLLSFTQKTSPD